MTVTRLVNKYKEPYDVLITRGTPFGNRFVEGKDGSREEIITLCRREQAERINTEPEFREKVLGLRGKTIACVCKPKSCHGDFIVEFLELGVADSEVRANTSPVRRFRDDFRFLSNFYPCEYLQISGYGTEYPTVEHYYQAAKTAVKEERDVILGTPYPDEVKKIAKTVTLRKGWEQAKLTVMFLGVLSKFEQNEYLRKKLLATGDRLLIEGNGWHDNFWGRCTCRQCGNFGLNHLGRILMMVRGILS